MRGSSVKMKLGLAQMDMVWENKEENIKKIEKMVQNAILKGIECLLFPEMSLTGFSMNTSQIGENSENGKTIEAISQLCKQYKIFIGIGYVEKSLPKSFNKYAIIDNNGVITANYAKIHPFSFGEESKYYAGGNKLEYCTIKNIITTPLICYDLRFPEIFQIASQNSYLITVAANWPAERRDHWLTLLKARAIENQCYIAGVNRFGQGNGIFYNGDSMIINPYGEIITEKIVGEGIISAEIDKTIVKEYRRMFRVKEDRRLELYRQL